VKGPGDKLYIAGHNLLRAHAYAYRAYNQEFRPTQNGIVTLF